MRKLHAHFCTENTGTFSGRHSPDANKETSRIETNQQQLFVPESRQICSDVIHSLGLYPSVSSVTPPELLHGLEQILSAEVRPKFLRHIDFRIAQLPEQKIRDPHFS